MDKLIENNSIEDLAVELLKKQPDEKKVRRLMAENHIPKTKDPVERLQNVIEAFQKQRG